MSKIIIIVSSPRTGSCLLVDAFNLYSPMWPMHEFFRNHQVDPDSGDDFSSFKQTQINSNEKYKNLYDIIPSTQFEINSNYINVLHAIHQLADSNETVIIKIQSYQFDPIDINELCKLPFVEFVFLQRSNRLESFISLGQLSKIQMGNNVNTNNVTINLNYDNFMEYIERTDQFDNYIGSALSKSGKNVLNVEYSKDLKDFTVEKFYNLVDHWLDQVGINLERKPYEIMFKRQRTTAVENCIENYEEVKELVDSYKELKYDTAN